MKRRRVSPKKEESVPSPKRVKTQSKVDYLSKEKGVGIRLFLQKDPAPVFGIMKQRSCDFHVHEIQREGVVRLTSFDPIPAPAHEDQSVKEEKELSGQDPYELLQKLIPSFPIDSFKQFINNFAKSEQRQVKKKVSIQNSTEETLVAPPPPPERQAFHSPLFQISAKDHPKIGSDKILRKKLHQIIRVGFNGRFQSEYGAKGVTDTFSVKYVGNKKKGRRRGASSRWKYKLSGDYVEFTLYKFNLTTKQAISLLARQTRSKDKTFTIAGNKDKRASTTQLVRGYKIFPEKLYGFNRDQIRRFSGRKQTSRMRIGNFKIVKSSLKIGSLNGNEFSIVLRNMTECYHESMKQMDAYLSNVRDVGFINYYGMQRFGYISDDSLPSTYDIGKNILCGDFDAVVRDILLCIRGRSTDPSLKDDDTLSRKIIEEFLQKKNYDETLNKLKDFRNVYSEKKLILSLRRNQGRPVDAFMSGVNRPMRMLYVHAYQSKVWNECVSVRIEKYGLKCVVGDLIYDDSNPSYFSLMNDNFANIEKKESSDFQTRAQVKVVKSEQEASKYSIYDVLMPIVGCDVIFPEHDVGFDFIVNNLLKRDGIQMERFKKLSREFATFGQYRKMILKPRGFVWKVTDYTDHEKNLIPTDLDLMNEADEKGRTGTDPKFGMGRDRPAEEEDEDEEEEIEGENDGKKEDGEESKTRKALVLTFQLPAGCYATMFTREILKTSSVLDWKSINEQKKI